MQFPVKDLTHVFKKTKCEPIAKALAKGGVVKGVKLCGFGGLLAREVMPGLTFKHEFAGRVKVIACLDEPLNIIHTDELPAHGLTLKEKAAVEKEMDDRHFDVTVLAWGPAGDVETAAKEIRLRALDAIQGVPSETRQAFADGTTGFERILPGPDRMYPDTDSPPTAITQERIARIRNGLVESPWTRVERYAKLGVPPRVAEDLAISSRARLFDMLVKEGRRPKFAATLLVEGLRDMRRRGVPIDAVPDEAIAGVFRYAIENGMSLSVIKPILERVAGGARVEDTALECGLEPVPDAEIAAAASGVTGKADGKFAAVMAKLRGRASPERVMKALKTT
jgi:glutamyl-tRNA(Gln) amidotransferase subunit E